MKTYSLYSRAFIAMLFSIGLLLFVALDHASAHASVISSTPSKGAVISSAPTTVTVETAENMNPDPKKSNLFVYGPEGDLISDGDAKVSQNNPKEMSVKIKPGKEGVYVVRWITASAEDGDPDEGAFTFSVQSTVAPTPTTSSTPASSTASSSNSTPLLPIILTGLVALLIGLGAGFGLGRNTTKAVASTASNEEPAQSRQSQEEASTKRTP